MYNLPYRMCILASFPIMILRCIATYWKDNSPISFIQKVLDTSSLVIWYQKDIFSFVLAYYWIWNQNTLTLYTNFSHLKWWIKVKFGQCLWKYLVLNIVWLQFQFSNLFLKYPHFHVRFSINSLPMKNMVGI